MLRGGSHDAFLESLSNVNVQHQLHASDDEDPGESALLNGNEGVGLSLRSGTAVEVPMRGGSIGMHRGSVPMTAW